MILFICLFLVVKIKIGVLIFFWWSVLVIFKLFILGSIIFKIIKLYWLDKVNLKLFLLFLEVVIW